MPQLSTKASGLTLISLLLCAWLSSQVNVVVGSANPAASAANERFALQLSTKIGLNQPRSNVAVSPIILQAALTLLYAGTTTGSPTAREMQRALELQHLGAPEQAVRQFQELVAALKQAAAVSCKLKLLSEFYTDQRYTFCYRDEFELLANQMGVGTQRLDFGKISAVTEHINYEFLTRSNYSVGEVIGASLLQNNGDTPFLHVSALTFRAPWAQGFDPQETQRLNFHTDEQNHKLVDFMFAQHRYKYADLPELNARLVELPFERSGLSLLIIYPNQVTGLGALERNLPNYDLQHLRRQLSEHKVALTLPKFNILVHSDLKQPLMQLGLGKLFTTEAHLSNAFSALLPSSLPHLTALAHTVLLEVQEAGGNAGDSFSFGDLFRRTVPLVINHPFYFAISNENVVLLAGHIVDI